MRSSWLCSLRKFWVSLMATGERRRGRTRRVRRRIAAVVALSLALSLAPALPASAAGPAAGPAAEFRALGSRVASWLGGVRDRFVGRAEEDPRGEMRPGARWSPPGRSGTGPAKARPKPPGERVRELTAKRTATRTVFELDDGRTQTELSSVPVRYRDGSGRWRDIDTRVARTSTGGFAYGNDGTGFATRFGDRSDRLVQVRLGDRRVTVGVAGAARRVTPRVTGSTVTYAGVWDGADLVYEVTPTAVKESI